MSYCIFPRTTVPFLGWLRPFQRPVRNRPLRNEPGSTYPPYNVEKHADDQYRIVIAAAGFQEDDLELQVEKGVLTVRAASVRPTEGVTFLHQGIAQRAFKLSFRLADHIEVKNAALANGLLSIDLLRLVPEEAKPKRIEINAQKTLTH